MALSKIIQINTSTFRRTYVQIVLFIILSMGVTGCIIAPVIDAYSQIGLSRADREKLLQKNIKSFNDNLYWGTPMEAMHFVKESERLTVAKQLKNVIDGVRIVDSKVEMIEYDETSYKANVTVVVKYFKVPYFVVLDRKESHNWEFSFSNGWQFVSLLATQ